MKRTFILLAIVIVIVCFFTGCGKGDSGGALATVTVTYETVNDSATMDNDTVIATSSYNIPTVSIEGNDEVAQKINDYLATVVKSVKERSDEALSYAQDYYLSCEDFYTWQNHSFQYTFEAKRTDKGILSFKATVYSYSGGAYPVISYECYNFSTVNGTPLELAELMEDYSSFKQYAKNIIIDTIAQSDYAQGVFEGYETQIDSLLDSNCFYLDNNGLVIICNEDIIGPHALGSLEFTFTYAELADYLK